ncbi:hypothetical protein BHE74_00045967 [Ensete ventricosum]|nr:hypothetical protein BHE74_00045967 [Ensete ventricosum]
MKMMLNPRGCSDRVLHSIHEKNEIIEEPQSKNNQYENDFQKFGYVDDTPHYPRELGSFPSRRRVKDKCLNNYNPKLDIPKFEGSIDTARYRAFVGTPSLAPVDARTRARRRNASMCGEKD